MSEALRLGPDDAEALVAIEKEYPRGHQEGLEKIRHKLKLLDSSEYSFAWGLFEEGQLVAYVIAYPGKSSIESREDESIIFIDDLYVAPDHAQLLYRLLKVLQFDLKEAKLGHLHLEGLSRRSFFRLVEEHPYVFRRLGYEVVGSYAYWDKKAGEEMFFARYAPLGGGDGDVRLSAELIEEMKLNLDK